MMADLILFNGKIATVDSRETIAEAVAVKFGRFLAVGKNEKIEPLKDGKTKVIDLEGKTVLPGFIDTHGHLANAGVNLGYIDCSLEAGVKSIKDIQAKITKKARTALGGEWIKGFNFDESKLAEKRIPNKLDLDRAAPNHPVFLTMVGTHVYVANSKAFELMAIRADTPDPPGGRFDRDPETGELTGTIYENAVWLVNPPTRFEDIVEGIKRMSKLYIASGITCFHDCFLGEGADGTIGCGNWMRAYQQLMKEGEPRLRVRLDVWYKMNPHLEKLGLLQGFGDDMLRINGLKMFLDGAISGRTAALLEPYLHKPNYYGMLTMTKDELKEAVFAAHRAGLRVSVHANGDKAIKLYLDVVEDVLRKYPRDDHRHRAIHCSIVNPELIERIKRLGVLPTIFGCYAYYHGDKLLSAFGPERAEWMFAARSMLDAGIRVAAHSDSDCSPYPPLMGIHSLVNRTTKAGQPYGLKQCISVMQAIKLYTINAAYQSFEENTLGSIEVGKFADVVVLGEDIFATPTEKINKIPIDMTIVGGKIVHQRQ